LLNERQAGAAIEGVDTHGYTDVAMAIAKLLGFDLWPRLKALKDRHLFLPHGRES
jgi:TnpA family transposase